MPANLLLELVDAKCAMQKVIWKDQRLPQNTQRSEVSAMAERARRGEGQGAWQQTQSVRGRCWWGQGAGLRSSSSRV